MKKILSFFIGFFNGLFGAGGGAVLVPFLVKRFGFTQKQAHASSVFFMLVLSIFTTLNLLTKADIVFKEVFFICLGGVVGGVISGKILYKIKNKTLSIIFSIVLILVGGKIVFL